MSLASESHAYATNPAAPLALMGGTFDPVHWGHLRVASETAAALRLPELRLVPSKTPVHRTRPGATEAQRFDMLALGISALNDPALRADNREITRATPSYTALTLESLRTEFPTRPLIWVSIVDKQIAAVAQAHQLTLVTRNVRDFAQIGVPLLNPFTEDN